MVRPSTPSEKGSESRMAPPSTRSAHVEESGASSSGSGLFAAFIARKKIFDCEQNRRNLQDHVDTLERRSKWLKICMDEQREDGLRNAMDLKTCIRKTSELQGTLHDRRGKREKVKFRRYLARSSC